MRGAGTCVRRSDSPNCYGTCPNRDTTNQRVAVLRFVVARIRVGTTRLKLRECACRGRDSGSSLTLGWCPRAAGTRKFTTRPGISHLDRPPRSGLQLVEACADTHTRWVSSGAARVRAGAPRPRYRRPSRGAGVLRHEAGAVSSTDGLRVFTPQDLLCPLLPSCASPPARK